MVPKPTRTSTRTTSKGKSPEIGVGLFQAFMSAATGNTPAWAKVSIGSSDLFAAPIRLAKKSGPKILRRMTRRRKVTTEPLFLGIECGGTRTTVVLTEYEPACFLQSKFGPANLRLLSDAQLVQHFRPIGDSLPKPTAIVIGMAGARTEADRERIRRAAAKVWPGVLCYATNDLETALEAAAGPIDHSGSRSIRRKSFGTGVRTSSGHDTDGVGRIPRVLVLSGTGSC